MKMEQLLLSIKKILDCSEECYAHISANGNEKETLCAHTELSQKYWIRIFRKKHIHAIVEKFEKEYLGPISNEAKLLFETMLMNIITFHDFGKVNPKFQKKKMGNVFLPELTPDNNIGSKHSILSSVFYLDYFLEKINGLEDKTEKEILKDFAYINSYIIARHHGKLTELKQYLEALSGTHTQGEDLGFRARVWLEKWKKEVEGEDKISKFRKSWNNLFERNGMGNNKKRIYLYGLTRLLYSTLVVSDYYATSEYMKGIEIQDLGDVSNCDEVINLYEESPVQKSIRSYEKKYYPKEKEALAEETDINVLRTELFLDAENRLKKNIDANIFYLEAPTGSGKSNTAMNLSLMFMKQNKDIRKIFYIYPFNTLVEQNMDSIDKVFGKNEKVMAQVAVVNSLVPLKERIDEDEWTEKKENEKYQKILLDRQFLNYPIILSTHVMLFRTLFGQHKEDAFGFYQLCNSVVVLDEIQSYRNDIWAEIISFFKGFAELLNMKIIIMSATLPNLEILTDNQTQTVHLIENREKYFKHPLFADRVIANYELLDQIITMDELMRHILSNIGEKRKILVEFIKKSSAEEFYKKIKDENTCPVFLMTGDSSIQDRKKIIENIKEMRSVLLIATQVIEAGVDIDMDIGYKDISRLDSEEQFMGRVNRSAKRSGVVYFFDFDDANEIYGSSNSENGTSDVRLEERFTLKMEKMRDILTTKDFSKFYEENILPELKIRNKEEDPKKNLDLFFKENVQKLNMTEIDKKMRLIDDDRNLLSVYFAREIIDENENIINGRELWDEYKELLENEKMDYSEKTVKVRNIRSKMNGFIYQLSEKSHFQKDEQIGDIYYIENGEEYFDENGILKREVFENEAMDLFI